MSAYDADDNAFFRHRFTAKIIQKQLALMIWSLVMSDMTAESRIDILCLYLGSCSLFWDF